MGLPCDEGLVGWAGVLTGEPGRLQGGGKELGECRGREAGPEKVGEGAQAGTLCAQMALQELS